MSLKFYKPVTPSLRHSITSNFKILNKNPLLKSKIVGFKNSSGRNNQGKITVYGKGCGHKKKYRKLEFVNHFTKGIVTSIEYDPCRTAYIASVYSMSQQLFFYTLAPLNLKVGNLIECGINAKIKLGNRLPLENIPVGSFVHNIDVNSNFQIAKAAGAFAILLEKTPKFCKIKLRSGEQRLILPKSYATLGIVSNEFKFLTSLGKAGRARWKNQKPTVRGVAMNPIDHPHGGGEGKKSGKAASLSPWGKSYKNKSTSNSVCRFVIQKRK